MLWIVVVGALGGMAPTLLKLAIDLTQGDATTIHNLNLSLLLGMALFGLLGAIVAGVWGEKNLKKVFYLGLGLPSLLTVANSHATQGTPATRGAAMFRPAPVFAATNPVSGRTIRVILPHDVAASQPQALFVTDEGERLTAITSTPIDIPPTAQFVSIRTTIGTSNAVSLPSVSGVLLTLTLKTEKNAWFGFQYAVGIHSDPYTVTATLAPVANATASLTAKAPIALAMGMAAGLLVLQRDGTVLIRGNDTLTPFATVPNAYLPIDLAATTVGGKPLAIVAGISRTDVPLLVLLSRDAPNVITTFPPGLGRLKGVVADQGANTVYASVAPNPQIYAWSITNASLTNRRVAAQVSNASSLGAMALDPSTHQLFVADPQDQKVYRVTLSTPPNVTMFLAVHQTINAMAFDETTHTLYVAGGDKLSAVATNGTPSEHPITTNLRDISGVAVATDNQIWVSDQGGAVRKITP